MRATSLGHAGILIETAHGTIVCDPWFVPAFFGSWFVFPRNDQLPDDVRAAVEHPDYLYISHLHGDHLDLAFLAEHIDRSATVLLPGLPDRRAGADAAGPRLRALRPHPRTAGRWSCAVGSRVTIHIETSISDGPGGDSALVVDDGEVRLLNMNDCRIHDLAPLTADGPIDIQWLQYSGAIWYPMVYDHPPEVMRRAGRSEGRGAVVAGPALRRGGRRPGRRPVSGPAVLPRPRAVRPQRDRRRRAVDLPGPDGLHRAAGRRAGSTPSGRLAIPGTDVRDHARRHHGHPSACPTPRSDAHLRRQAGPTSERYAADWAPWLAEQKAAWPVPAPDLVGRLKAWWEPLLALAPTLRQGVGANVLVPGRRRRRPRRLPRAARCGRTTASRSPSPSTCPGRSWRRSWPSGPSTGPTPCSCRAASGPGGPGSSTSSSTTSSSRSPTSASSGPRPRPGTGWRRRPRSRRSSSAAT